MSTVHIMESVNLFMGNDDPTGSNHLELSELKWPDPTFITADHQGGGAVMGMTFMLNMLQALKPTMKLLGPNPDRLKRFGAGSGYREIYTAYGVVRDKRSGRSREAKGVIEGMIVGVTGDAFSRGSLVGFNYAWEDVSSYTLTIEGEEMWSVDVWTNTLRIGGVDRFSDTNRILRVPTAV